MGAINPPEPAKLLVGLLAGDERHLDRAREILQDEHGSIDLISPVWPFTATNYYRTELGENVLRQFVFFERLVDVDRLAAIKIGSNQMEERLCEALDRPRDRRPVNIDPGYMTLGKFVLATTKDRAHRLYIGRGIWAEVTLHYRRGRWEAWPWTYPDYKADTYQGFFEEARTVLKTQLSARR